MSLIFVHGITVRRDRFDRLLQSIVDGFSDAGCTLPVSGCYWGDLGRSPGYTGASIPGFSAGVRSAGTQELVSGQAALLTLLLEDPLAELADLRDTQELGLETAGFRPFPPEVRRRSDALRAAESPVKIGSLVQPARSPIRTVRPDAERLLTLFTRCSPRPLKPIGSWMRWRCAVRWRVRLQPGCAERHRALMGCRVSSGGTWRPLRSRAH